MLLPAPVIPQVQLDAQALEGVLHRQFGGGMSKIQLISIASGLGISKPRAEKALRLLAASGRVVSSGTGRSGIVHLMMSPVVPI